VVKHESTLSIKLSTGLGSTGTHALVIARASLICGTTATIEHIATTIRESATVSAKVRAGLGLTSRDTVVVNARLTRVARATVERLIAPIEQITALSIELVASSRLARKRHANAILTHGIILAIATSPTTAITTALTIVTVRDAPTATGTISARRRIDTGERGLITIGTVSAFNTVTEARRKRSGHQAELSTARHASRFTVSAPAIKTIVLVDRQCIGVPPMISREERKRVGTIKVGKVLNHTRLNSTRNQDLGGLSEVDKLVGLEVVMVWVNDLVVQATLDSIIEPVARMNVQEAITVISLIDITPMVQTKELKRNLEGLGLGDLVIRMEVTIYLAVDNTLVPQIEDSIGLKTVNVVDVIKVAILAIVATALVERTTRDSTKHTITTTWVKGGGTAGTQSIGKVHGGVLTSEHVRNKRRPNALRDTVTIGKRLVDALPILIAVGKLEMQVSSVRVTSITNLANGQPLTHSIANSEIVGRIILKMSVETTDVVSVIDDNVITKAILVKHLREHHTITGGQNILAKIGLIRQVEVPSILKTKDSSMTTIAVVLRHIRTIRAREGMDAIATELLPRLSDLPLVAREQRNLEVLVACRAGVILVDNRKDGRGLIDVDDIVLIRIIIDRVVTEVEVVRTGVREGGLTARGHQDQEEEGQSELEHLVPHSRLKLSMIIPKRVCLDHFGNSRAKRKCKHCNFKYTIFQFTNIRLIQKS